MHSCGRAASGLGYLNLPMAHSPGPGTLGNVVPAAPASPGPRPEALVWTLDPPLFLPGSLGAGQTPVRQACLPPGPGHADLVPWTGQRSRVKDLTGHQTE